MFSRAWLATFSLESRLESVVFEEQLGLAQVFEKLLGLICCSVVAIYLLNLFCLARIRFLSTS